jgi:hypothetical protein
MIIGDSSRAMLALTEAMVVSTFDVVASVMDSESLVLEPTALPKTPDNQDRLLFNP